MSGGALGVPSGNKSQKGNKATIRRGATPEEVPADKFFTEIRKGAQSIILKPGDANVNPFPPLNPQATAEQPEVQTPASGNTPPQGSPPGTSKSPSGSDKPSKS